MKEEYIFIGVDIGTTGVRAAAYEKNGTLFYYADEYYSIEMPRPNYAEQNHELIFNKTKKVIKEVANKLLYLRKKPLGISLSVAMHSFALAKKDKFLSNMLIWADSRASKLVKDYKAKSDNIKYFYDKTCCPPHSCYPYFKMLYFKQNYENLDFDRVYSLKDYIFEQLTGFWCIDKSCACASGFYNANDLNWDDDLLYSLGLKKENLPEVKDTIFNLGLKEEIAKELNLAPDLPVVIGSSDGVLVNLGISCFKEGQMSATIGTSGALRLISNGVKKDSSARTWCYNLLDDTWVVGGAINNGGIVLKWLRDKICHYSTSNLENIDIDAYELMSLKASKVAVGSEGLLALPFFTGERAPHWNSELKGMFFGLGLNHSRSHMIRAVMEGICYGLKSIYNPLSSFKEPTSIKVSGSFTKSSVWIQILADILNRDIILPKNSEGAAYGAAILGFISLGLIDNLDDLEELESERIFHAQSENFDLYNRIFKIYENLYSKLQDEFAQIYEIGENKI
ncbi:gluconokinase [Campylobacter sp. B0100352/1]|uniref:gluconokinase n=1 Tax=Campylobacter sp. B0100352/1 TaxID=2735783 RepID=UPI001DB67701|nr:gluconokinase [Campylobacter sp. B0100352/1]